MKYIIYAQGTMSNDGRENALYQRRGNAPIYTTSAYADRFDEAEADRITRYKGRYVWVKKAVKDASIDDDKHSQLSELAKQYKELYLGKSKTKPHPRNSEPGPKKPLSQMTESINAALNSAFSDDGDNEDSLKRLSFAIEQSEAKQRAGELSKFGIKNLARGRKIFAALQNDIKNHTLPNTAEKMKERLMSAGRYEMLASKPTGRQVEALLNRGYTREQISNMTSEEAHNINTSKPRRGSVNDYNARTQEDKLTSYSLEFRKRMNANPKKKAEILLEAKAAYDNVVEDTDISAKQDIKRSADKHWKDLQGFADKLNDSIQDKLIQSSSKEALNKNTATEIKAGKDPKQAAAIAYSIQKENDSNMNDNKIKDTKFLVHAYNDGKLLEEKLVNTRAEAEQLAKEFTKKYGEDSTSIKLIWDSSSEIDKHIKSDNSIKDAMPVKVIAKKAMEMQDGCSRHYLEVEDCDGKHFYMVTDEYDGCSRQFAGGGSIIQDKATLSKKYKDDLASGLTGVVKSVASGVKEVKSALPKLDENTVDPSIYKAPLDEMIKAGKVKDGVSATAVDAILGVNNVAATKQLLKDAGIKYSAITSVVSTYQIIDGKCVKIDK